MCLPLGGLWRNPDFIKLWAGQTVSQLGTLMAALQLIAVLALHATPVQMGVLAAMNVVPGLTFGLLAGVWVDRLRRKTILVVADLGRAALIVSIPAAFLLDMLHIEHLYVVAFGSGVLTIFFDVAYRSYLPSLVVRRELVEANSKLSASESVVEVTAFSIGGWIAQLAGAITLAVVDALSFIFSGIVLSLIAKREPVPSAERRRQGVLEGIRDGLLAVWRNGYLRTIAVVTVFEGLVDGVFGALILIYGIEELGFQAGVLGTIFAIGGISSVVGATMADSVTRNYGRGRVMILGALIAHLATFLIPLARGPLMIASAVLVAAQIFGDGPATIYAINKTSLLQSATSDDLLGRVNASLRVVQLGATLVGSLGAGVLGELIGLRWTLLTAAGIGMIAWLRLALSPVRRLDGDGVNADGVNADG